MTPGGVLCLVTDRRRLVPDDPECIDRLIDLIARAARAGVNLVQIRESGLDDRTLTDVVKRAVELTAPTQTRVLVNDRVDVAVAAGAAGVHLRHDSCPAERVRSICPDGWLVGRSVHTADEAEQVANSGVVDYLIMGTVFESASKPGGIAAGVGELREVVQRVRRPVLAIGGITVDRAESIARTGAAGIAAVGAFVSAGSGPGLDLQRVVSGFRDAFDKGRSASKEIGMHV